MRSDTSVGLDLMIGLLGVIGMQDSRKEDNMDEVDTADRFVMNIDRILTWAEVDGIKLFRFGFIVIFH